MTGTSVSGAGFSPTACALGTNPAVRARAVAMTNNREVNKCMRDLIHIFSFSQKTSQNGTNFPNMSVNP
jgi:hypothetical protein